MQKNDERQLSVPTPSPFHIRDFNQKVLDLRNNTLIATPHSDEVTPVDLESVPCRDKECLAGNHGTAIYLGIRGKELCLFCEESGGQPILKLKNNQIMKLYHTENAQKPFLFYQNQTESTSTFESAAYPGWFICTSNEKDRPVTMTQTRGTNYYTDFYITPLS
ncbi:interleukin-36 alpha-like [Trichosurus vulpecula]|uniref:interleukin-36 alpha-like n=1 Tax=Trichosurus vulpecula TaxID=9337 RepID=UPI00186B1ED0|nr:interleukin-36 alpha-like [Trichosurus vulpecula]